MRNSLAVLEFYQAPLLIPVFFHVVVAVELHQGLGQIINVAVVNAIPDSDKY